MSGFTPDVSQWAIVRTGFLQGVGFGLIFVPLSTVTFATLPPELAHRSHRPVQPDAQYRQQHRHLDRGQPAGQRPQANHADIVAHVTPFNRLFQDPDITRFWNPLTAAGRAALDDEITRQATVIAYINDFKLMMITALIAIPLVFLLRRGKQPPSAPPVVAD